MLYFFSTEKWLPALLPVSDLEIKEVDDPLLMSVVGKISVEDAVKRLANDNKAFVAYYKGIPAAFGWMAMGKAKIGELGHEFVLPLGHRYLWNFRTLEEFRGLGIYPRLLQFIVTNESRKANCFWIMHAPENTSSEKGIVKAGFHFAGRVSVRHAVQLITREDNVDAENTAVIRELGFNPSDDEPATCWNCTSPHMAHKKSECCCRAKGMVCNEALFALS